MQKKVVVLSLGGSLIIPDEVDVDYLKKFREIIKRNTNKYKFVIVCGGGSVARKYISALREDNKPTYLQDLVGISSTRLNARFIAYFFGKDPNWGIPHDMGQISNLLKREEIIFCGALRYAPNQTSDSTACKLAAYLKTDFINLTNIKGLYTKNPEEHKDAKFIPKISREGFAKIVNAIPQKPGMHAPVDHTAMKVIMQNKLRVFIIGKDSKQLNNLLNGKAFVGTIIN